MKTKGNRKTVSRRDFIRAAGAAGVGSVLMAGKSGANGSRTPKAPGAAEGLPNRVYGRTGVEVPVLALGGEIDYTQNQLLLKQALKLGVMYWDTADYAGGKSETGIGMYLEKHPDDRGRIFLVSKGGERTAEGMERRLNQSLERMKTGYVDMYFFWYVEDIAEVDKKELRDWAEKAKRERKIRFVGLSSHKNMAPVLAGAAKLGWLDGLMSTLNYRIMHEDDMREAVDACHAAGLGVTAMKVQGGGPISDTPEDRKLAGHFVSKGYTAEQAKVKAILENPRIASVCSLMPTVDILEANVAAALDGRKLSRGDWKALERHAAATCGTFCGACGRCERAMARKVPVSDVMRYLMYSRNYGEEARARDLLAALPAAVRARLASGDFSRAMKACPRRLPIARLMREAWVLANT